jgi:uncharacterized membrane protein YfcA
MMAALVACAFVAGLVDAIGGGGGLITVPALLTAGLPPHVALGTNKGQAIFGSGAALLTFLRRGTIDRTLARITFPLGFIGSLLGALLVLSIPSETLKPVVLVLLPVAATTLFIRRRESRGARPERARLMAALLALGIGAYDGFFGPGTGTFLVIGFAFLLHAPLLHASADAKVVNFASNLAALCTFAFHGTLLLELALPMAAAQLVGGYTGARLAIRGGERVIRAIVVVVVAGLMVKLAYDLFG